VVLDEQRAQVVIGRGEDADLVVKGTLISRLHARIESNRNRFLLVDESTNGTFVRSADGEEAFIRRDSLPLTGAGMIGLGAPPEPGAAQTIHFLCEA
jgi:adenylate cyclase